MISRVHKQGRVLFSRFLMNMVPRRKLFIVLVLFAQVVLIRGLPSRSDGFKSFSNNVERRRRNVSPDKSEDVQFCKSFTLENQQFMKSYVKEVRNDISVFLLAF